MTSNEFCRQARENHNTDLSAGTLSKYFPKKDSDDFETIKIKTLPLGIVCVACKVFGATIDQLANEKFAEKVAGEDDHDHDTEEKKEPVNTLRVLRHVFENRTNFVFDADANKDVFKFYEGTYHCYFHPTIYSERKSILTGEITFSIKDGFCKTTLKINTGKHLEGAESRDEFIKQYDGLSLISRHVDCWYSILAGENVAEMVFVCFRYIKPNARYVDCRIAEVLTSSAGGSRYPVVLRVLLSRDEINEEHFDLISPHLTMNTSDIYITQENLRSLKETHNHYKSVIESLERYECENNSPPKETYILGENIVRETAKRLRIKDVDINKFITLLRAESVLMYHNKVSEKADDLVRNLLVGHGYFDRSPKESE
jgi:hypothetical protein